MNGRIDGAQLQVWLLLGSLMVSSPTFASAQLISPGKLTAAHAEASGVLSCTRCHNLGKRGAANDKCLECHVPLRNRVEEQKGLHATFSGKNCGECHKEHFGPDFDMVQLDTAAFRHDSTGFGLAGAHAEAGCRECHQAQFIVASDVREYVGEHEIADSTFLGVGASCMTCHEPDDPHASQFSGRGCDECHGDSSWEELSAFDHNDSRYRLTGLHRDVECNDCHQPVRRRGAEPYTQYLKLAFAKCTDCHEDDHDGEMGEECSECHNTRGWERINRTTFEGRFDHEATEFRLNGAHADAECRACHGPRPKRDDEVYISFVSETREQTYPQPVAEDCLSCHRDFHEREFESAPGGAVCESCHGQAEWSPAEYDIERHNRDAEFALEGAHVATPCFACHERAEGARRPARWHFEASDCVSCHETDDPHQQQFPDAACDDCHEAESFEIAGFDHDDTRYPLDGRHRSVRCEDCHPEEMAGAETTFVRYRPLGMDCRDCHEAN